MGLLNSIRNIFVSTTSHSVTLPQKKEGAYYFHEDFYCQIEFLPRENFAAASQTADDITRFSEENSDGTGWANCFIRSGAGIPTASKSFKASELADFLQQHGFNEYPGVTTGYGSTEIPCENTRAFQRQSIVICFDYKQGRVNNIWLNLSPHAVDYPAYKTILFEIASKYDLLLADWWKDIIVDIARTGEIEKYFSIE